MLSFRTQEGALAYSICALQHSDHNFTFVPNLYIVHVHLSRCRYILMSVSLDLQLNLNLVYTQLTKSIIIKIYIYMTIHVTQLTSAAPEVGSAPPLGGGAVEGVSPPPATSTSTLTPNGSRKLETACPTP